MSYLIGTDEAGYGPNLGPLVVVATIWRVADTSRNIDLYQRLSAVVSRTPPRTGNGRARRIAIADSKRLYSPAHGLAQLERGVLAALGMLGGAPADWLAAWNGVCPGAMADGPDSPWHADYELALPLETDGTELAQLVPRLTENLADAGVQLVAIRGRAAFPPRFNDLIERHGGKGEALSRLTIELVAEALAGLDAPATVVCDKHGGRNRYGPLLQQQFPDDLVRVVAEGREESQYRVGPRDSLTAIYFRARGESDLAAALASMTAKYLRELAMRALNDYWCRQVPGLRPTAGYPQDARRFKRDIAARQQELGIDDHLLWRVR